MNENLKLRSLGILLLMCLFSFGAYAQGRQVSGTVTDAKGEPQIGVSVGVKGTTQGTMTDIDGKFKIKVPSDKSVLRFTYVGFKPHEVTVGKQSTFKIVLHEEAKDLDEVVVIGYGTVRKGELTGATASINEKMLKDIPVASAAEALTGRLSGVQVTTTEGSPDAEIQIRVRGGGSITQDNSPLYIVDGFPVNSIGDISPSDIKDMRVLKDAASTAIYGARGANGVILITTKEGTEGKITVDFNAYWGAKKITKYLDMMSPYDYVMWQYELDPSSKTTPETGFNRLYGAYQDLDIYKSKQGTNWQKEVFGRTAFQQNFNLNISGGSKATKFSLGLNHIDENSIMIGSGFQKSNINFKLKTEINKHLSFDFNTRLNYQIVDGAGVSSGSGSTTRLRNSLKYAPVKGISSFGVDQEYDDDDDVTSSSLLYNPVESTNDEYKKRKRFSNNYQAAVNWKIIKPLTFRSEWGYEFKREHTEQVWGPSTSTAKGEAGKPSATFTKVDGSSYRIANTLTYDQRNFVKGHNLNIVLGQEVYAQDSEELVANSKFFPQSMTTSEILAMMSAGKAQPTETTIALPNRLSSFFGRINYSALDRYLATVTFRADGSSKFAKGNRWGFFPSAAFAWRVSGEPFMVDYDWISDLKIRVSVGTAGNNRISDGLWKNTYNGTESVKDYYINGEIVSYLVPGKQLANPDLKWETTLTRNIGVDYSFWNSRVSGALDFYWNTTHDLLIEAPIASSSGYTTQYQNFGRTSNKGIEFNVDALIVNKKDFSLSASFNIGFNKNRVEKFKNGESNYKTYSSKWNGNSAAPFDDYIIREGEAVGQMYGYITGGMYTFDDFDYIGTGTYPYRLKGDTDGSKTEAAASLIGAKYFGPGSLKLVDKDGNIATSTDAKTVIGNANPDLIGGFNLTARYKGFDLSAFFNFSIGNDVYNANKIDNSCYSGSRKYNNLVEEMKNRFTYIDPATGYLAYNDPVRLAEINKNATIWSPYMTTAVLHSWAVEDGSFLRFNNLTLGYTFPKRWVKKLGLTNLRIYGTVYNVCVITGYSGFDPEVSTRNSTAMTPGVDYSAYPKSRSFIGGVNVSF